MFVSVFVWVRRYEPEEKVFGGEGEKGGVFGSARVYVCRVCMRSCVRKTEKSDG